MTPTEFKALTGRDAERDDLERANCPDAGQYGHFGCGVCGACGFPRFVPRTDDQVLPRLGKRIICNHQDCFIIKGGKNEQKTTNV